MFDSFEKYCVFHWSEVYEPFNIRAGIGSWITVVAWKSVWYIHYDSHGRADTFQFEIEASTGFLTRKYKDNFFRFRTGKKGKFHPGVVFLRAQREYKSREKWISIFSEAQYGIFCFQHCLQREFLIFLKKTAEIHAILAWNGFSQRRQEKSSRHTP